MKAVQSHWFDGSPKGGLRLRMGLVANGFGLRVASTLGQPSICTLPKVRFSAATVAASVDMGAKLVSSTPLVMLPPKLYGCIPDTEKFRSLLVHHIVTITAL